MAPLLRLKSGALAAGAILALAIGLVACGNDEESDASRDAQAPATEREKKRDKEPSGASLKVRVRDGKPVGGPKELEAKKGEQVRIAVTSDAPGRIHLHGYEAYEEAAPGKAAVFDFKADIEGLFDMEVEATGTELAELEVSP